MVFSVTPQQLNPIEDALFELGALSISLVSDTDEPVLEPMPGETPLWSGITLKTIFSTETDIQALRLALGDLVPGAEVLVNFIGDKDWQAGSTNHAVNRVFGGKLWLRPKEIGAQQLPPEAIDGPGQSAGNLIPLVLEPGLAFGSGSHPTTRLCLAWLAEHVLPGQRVLDFGCGSGVLSLAAALLGAGVLGVDHDPQALLATRENATYNSLGDDKVMTLAAGDWSVEAYRRSFDIVVANILAAPLQELAEDFQAVAKPGAHIILSGVLIEQVNAVADCYQHTHFQPPLVEDGWALMRGVVA